MGGIQSKARLVADRAKLLQMISDYQRRKPPHLSEIERVQLIDDIADRVRHVDEQVRAFELAE